MSTDRESGAFTGAGEVGWLTSVAVKSASDAFRSPHAIAREWRDLKFTAAPESVYIFSKMGTEPWTGRLKIPVLPEGFAPAIGCTSPTLTLAKYICALSHSTSRLASANQGRAAITWA